MNYDIFISYSRKDMEIADRICRALDAEGVSYFIDRQGIRAATEFPDVIADAIKGCRKMLFLASKNSYKSKFTKREIYFAFNEKNEGDILPYCIDDAPMPDSLKFVFSTTNYRTMVDHPIETTLVDDILSMLGRERRSEEVLSQKNVIDEKPNEVHQGERSKERSRGRVEWQTIKKWLVWILFYICLFFVSYAITLWVGNFCKGEKELEPTDESEIVEDEVCGECVEVEEVSEIIDIGEECAAEVVSYKVGDYYDDGTKKGVVFYVSDNGAHGKIVSLDQAEKEWSTLEQYRKEVIVGALSTDNGKVNTDKVMARRDSMEYPAFNWCRAKGKDWYLPAKDELELLLLNDSVRYAVNSTLAQYSPDVLSVSDDNPWYWSSSEDGAYCAWLADMDKGITGIGFEYKSHYIRAVAAF